MPAPQPFREIDMRLSLLTLAPLVLAFALHAQAVSADIISVSELALVADRSTLHVRVGELDGRIALEFSLGVGEEGDRMTVVCREAAIEWNDDILARLTHILHDTTRITYSLEILVQELGLTLRDFSSVSPRALS